MMTSAEWYGEFVAHLSTQCPVLARAQMMGIGGLAATNQTRLLGDKPHVLAVTNPPWLGMCEFALINVCSAASPSRPPPLPLTL